MKIRSILLLCFLSGIATFLVSCSISPVESQRDPAIVDTEDDSSPSEDDSLVIWWQQSFVSQGNEEIAGLVQEWEKKSGIKTTLKLKSEAIYEQLESSFAPGLYRNIAQGNAPDIITIVDLIEIVPQLAWEGKLADVSDVIEPIADSFYPGALDAVNYLNSTLGDRSFYAIPMGIGTHNIHYWKPYLNRLGLTDSDIPQDWHGFWQFWQDVRDRLHQLGEKEISSFCITLNKEASDGTEAFLQFLHGHNGNIFDREGRFVLDLPENRQALINALSQLYILHRNGYIPPESMEWTNADNNFYFLDRQCLLVTNGTLSIPVTQKQADNPYTQKVRNRYMNEIVTMSSWPNTVKGSPLKIFIGQSFLVYSFVPANAKRPEAAKQFLAYLLQPENLQLLIEQEKGRFLPPMPELLHTSLWQKPDPHLAAVESLSAENIQAYPTILNPAYAKISKKKIFTTALERVIQEGVSPEEAADDAIAQIQDIINHY
ncbi:MAG: carbohydrate ABC transporter substrate-binding protein [Roseofilum sp. SBFL]|uniref:sugar ABC transporter substrate-binding protein n=1 Tax=unclassified Roseofilum TaxID=2620099 RepID=UPI001B22D976|nr:MULTISPECIES: ABC transporter substrate-binding protein [unclassified Roseofilum]MBP0014450.1 carbohydrate ABC transporter substrate-binding protein [Roseofilum sp. SID3]MBP0024184.1 carbohydrate ABC transporter substrate-binding protein [Roseofilum sp. SID2]MBP0037010.1 carbohydrate ABC transporter substrate-binding protein [Roseofilum sp. SID1]MBP0041484.1 carbohydrate ABC transporter substrate-binding protein [Roseofilum sp. SBFL]